MISKFTSVLTAASLAGGLALAPVVFAQGTPSPTPPAAPAAPNGPGMMEGQGMMNGRGMGAHGGMMGMMGMMTEMTRMIGNCNRMMESSNMDKSGGGGTEMPSAPGQKG